jgi:hypothetical protein
MTRKPAKRLKLSRTIAVAHTPPGIGDAPGSLEGTRGKNPQTKVNPAPNKSARSSTRCGKSGIMVSHLANRRESGKKQRDFVYQASFPTWRRNRYVQPCHPLDTRRQISRRQVRQPPNIHSPSRAREFEEFATPSGSKSSIHH